MPNQVTTVPVRASSECCGYETTRSLQVGEGVGVPEVHLLPAPPAPQRGARSEGSNDDDDNGGGDRHDGDGGPNSTDGRTRTAGA